MDKNRIGGIPCRTSGQGIAKSTSIQGAGCKSGGCASKAFELTSGDLPSVSDSRLRPERSGLTGRQKSAAGVVRTWVRKAQTVPARGNGSGKYAAQLMSDRRQKNQMYQAFPADDTGEAPRAARRGSESLAAKRSAESPVIDERLMEEICKQENCRQALGRVKANRGSSGVDGMTVEALPGYLRQHWPTIRDQLMRGT